MSKILIIEDEEAIAELEKDYLELSGFEVIICNRGDLGLNMALKEDFDLIILDLMLPEIDGFEICRQVREAKNTPIIMVSAKKDDIDKIRGLGLGADDYMTKPFSPSELVARVKAHMDRYNRLIGSTTQKNDIIEIRGIKIDKTARRVWVNGEEKTFTTKEFDLLTFLAQNPNRVFTKEELFREIWDMESVGDIATVTVHIKKIREKVGNGRVLLALSGGVDSSVAAGLLSRAIGKQLTCVFVDHGLLRKDEGDEVEAVFGPKGQFDLNFIRVNAQERYYNKLAGVTEPEAKRKIIGEEFIRIFEEEAKKIGAVDFLAQGTIYPDVVESGLGGESAVIKSHHNVGGLPDYVDFKEIIEPLRDLFKDEVRKAGLELGLPEKLVFRQPFPGPGLGIRIIGEVTADKVRIVQDADAIYREEIANAGLDRTIGQYFAALTNMRSVGVMGDERTYDYAVALRAVNTVDFMTAEAAEIPYEVLNKVMSRIINEVRGVNRVFYDLTSKPPGTIEFE